MPQGTRHELIGLLLRDGNVPVLQIAGGGTWRIDLGIRAAWRARSMFGSKVTVTGVREGFDLIAVRTIDRS